MARPPRTSQSAIVDVAVRLLEEQGAERFSLRGVAAALGLVPNALYRHVPDKAGLLALVAERGAVELLEAVQTRAAHPSTFAEGLAALSAAYLQFADERPALYAITVQHHGDAPSEGQRALWEHVCERAGGGPDGEEAARLLWATLHGLATLRESGAMDAVTASHTARRAAVMIADSISRTPRAQSPVP